MHGPTKKLLVDFRTRLSLGGDMPPDEEIEDLIARLLARAGIIAEDLAGILIQVRPKPDVKSLSGFIDGAASLALLIEAADALRRLQCVDADT